ncbi:MAG: hypothetical protein DMG62_24450 [Acidobacteria bacterium]|nr:MAG: hypothetical protein DMG62_24450 [Acidobacteriota bacterium]
MTFARRVMFGFSLCEPVSAAKLLSPIALFVLLKEFPNAGESPTIHLDYGIVDFFRPGCLGLVIDAFADVVIVSKPFQVSN